MIAALLLMSFSRMWRLYALLFALGAAAMLAASALALRRRWPVFSGVARAIGRITWFKGWLDGKRSVIESAEKNLFEFYYETPGAFWQSVSLNVACHGTAILEVYILLCFMGARSGLFLALVLEALTKLINIVGTINPGNVGTYEGGNMMIFRLLGVSGAAGLTMALCRRARILFWAAIGALCLIMMSKEPLNNRQFGRRQEFQNCTGREFPLDCLRPCRNPLFTRGSETLRPGHCQPSAVQIQVYQREAGAQSMMVLLNPAISDLLEAEDALQNPERMFHLRSHSGLHSVLGLL
jgi:hypothetical protein